MGAGTPESAAWHVDPSGKHELRYWDGIRWTEHVSDAGTPSIDPLDDRAGRLTAVATTVNARTSGSRFLGECTITVADGRLSITGRRLQEPWPLLRTLATVAFIPALFAVPLLAIVGAANASAVVTAGAVLCAAILVAVLCVLVYTDIWSPGHAPVETASWPVGAVTGVRRVKDATRSAGAPLPSIAMRALDGKNALTMRVPVGAQDALRTLTLRPAPESLAAIEAVLAN